MPELSRKGINMPSSPIRKLVPYAEQAQRDGKKIYFLNIGQPDIETPEVMLNALKHFDKKVVAYSHSAGNEPNRKIWIEYYKKLGINLSLENLMVTTGGSEALTFGLFSCLDPGDEIIIPEPFYANYNGFAQSGSIVVKPITTSIETGFSLPPIEEFEKLITPKTKAILICNPNNPTGYRYTLEELEALRDIVLKHDLFLFSDEVYREFCYDGKPHISVLTMEGLEQHAIVIDSISKRYSACGARIGAIVSRNTDVIATALKFAQARLSPPTLAQVLASASLEVPQQYFDDVLVEYTKRRDTLVAALNEIPGVICPKPGGAFYAMVHLPVDDAEKFCQWILDSFDYEGQTVLMAPGKGFYATPGLGTQEVRIAYVLNENDLKAAVAVIAHALEEYPGTMTEERELAHSSPAK